jgi:hypothetical protein
MENKIQKYNPTDRFLFRCGGTEVEIGFFEYQEIDKLLLGINNGQVDRNSMIKIKKTGEWMSLAHFSYLIRKKSSEPKVFGEDIKL